MFENYTFKIPQNLAVVVFYTAYHREYSSRGQLQKYWSAELNIPNGNIFMV